MRPVIWFRVQERRLHQLLWADGAFDCRPPKRWGIAVLRHGWIVAHGFRVNRLAPQAASLTYAALLALVPFLLLAFLVARGMNMQALLRNAAAHAFGARLPAPVEQFLHSAIELVDQTNTVPLGVMGLVILIASVVHLMRTIHLSLNRIWRVHRPPFHWWQILSYAVTTLIGPAVLLAAAWIPLILSSLRLTGLLREHFGLLAVLLEPLGTAVFVIGAFTAIYRFAPSTRVNWRPALFGGVIAGFAWICWQYLCAWMQSGVSSYNTIYGAFAVLPFMLIWMYTNWTILLIGGELSFANQYYTSYDPDSERIRPSSLEAVLLAAAALATVCECARRGETFDTARFSARYGVPEGVVLELLDQLALTGLLQRNALGYAANEQSPKLTLAEVNKSIYAMTNSGMPFTRRMPARLRHAFEAAREVYLARLQQELVVDVDLALPPPAPDAPVDSAPPMDNSKS